MLKPGPMIHMNNCTRAFVEKNFFPDFFGMFLSKDQFFWLKFRFFVYNTKIGILAKKIDPSTKTSRKSLEKKLFSKNALVQCFIRTIKPAFSIRNVVGRPTERYFISLAHFCSHLQKIRVLRAKPKSRFGPKKSILRQKCTKKVRKKKFPEKCSCAMFYTDNLTQFWYPKCCGATYRTVWRLFDAFWPHSEQC